MNSPVYPAAGQNPAAPVAPVALVGFVHALGAAGMPTDVDRTATFVRAVGLLGITTAAVHRAGRITLVCGPDDIPVYDRVFGSFFGAASGVVPGSPDRVPGTSAPLLREDPGGDHRGDDPAALPGCASAAERLRHRDFADLDDDERREIAGLLRLLRTELPGRRSRRRRPHHRGPVDRRRTTAAIIAAAGEPVRPVRQRRTNKPRRVVLLIDVSGSMEPYADTLLRFAHLLCRRRPGAVEVFTIGTRLTRVTRALAVRDPASALRAAAAVIPDYSGGTRLGEVLQAFLDRWGRRGTARGAVVVVFSDGWERGDPVLLADTAEQLRRLSERLIWANPHRAREGYQPVQAGIAAVAPHLDGFVSGHSLAALEELLEVMRGA